MTSMIHSTGRMLAALGMAHRAHREKEREFSANKWISDGENASDCAVPGFHCSTLNILNKASFIVSKAQTGGWNDLDMLTVGLGGQTDAEYVAHFSLWAALKRYVLSNCRIKKLKANTTSQSSADGQ